MQKTIFNFSFCSILTLLVIAGLPAQSDALKWIKPTTGEIANPFGNGYGFFGYYRAGHTGIDIKTHVGTPVVAVDAGIVRFVKTKPNMRYGNYIVIEHNNGLFTLYGHLLKVLVTVNKKVTQGELIAMTGVSGLASYPHLHFEVTNKIPIRDGAWGYNYICQMRNGSTNEAEIKKELAHKPPIVDLISFDNIKHDYNFLDAPLKQMDYFYRMKNNHCVQVPIAPIIYYNPELFLPKFEKSSLPNFDFKYRNKNKRTIIASHPRPVKIIKKPEIKIHINRPDKTGANNSTSLISNNKK